LAGDSTMTKLLLMLSVTNQCKEVGIKS
jgi:hypothetical protein